MESRKSIKTILRERLNETVLSINNIDVNTSPNMTLLGNMKDEVEIRAKLPLPSLMMKYRDWTKVSRLLATGLIGIERREIIDDPLKK